MDILFYGYQDQTQTWIDALSQRLPQARLRLWQAGDDGAADYAVVRNPPAAMLRPRAGLKAMFNLGAGVDGLLGLLRREGVDLPPEVVLIRLDDAGMAEQMTEYVSHAVLHFFRGFDLYAAQQSRAQWAPLPSRRKQDFAVGIMGMGVLGAHIARALAGSGFPVRGWSRTARRIEGVPSYAGSAGLAQFLDGLSVLVNMLPLTAETENILNRSLFSMLPRGAYLVNVARGAHLVEEDLLAAIGSGQLAGARLDVCRVEPLPADHPFWREPRISITPHISANIVMEDSVAQIAAKIHALESGLAVAGMVDRQSGY